jgi:tRNA A58 N-methylase Trm61
MKDQFSAVVKVGSKMTTFAKSADSIEKLEELLNKQGMSIANVVTIKTFKVSVEKQRGRTKAKY